MKLTNSQISIILKGVCHSMLTMVKPSLIEINKMLEEFGMELIIKPTSYSYRGFPSVSTWYIKGTDTRPNGIGSGILEWCVCESDAYEMLASMQQFSHFTDLKVGNTEWEEVEDNSWLEHSTKPTSQSNEFVLTFEEAINYLINNPEGKVTYESAEDGAYVHNSTYKGWFAWSDDDGLGNAKWFKEIFDTTNNRFYSLESWAIIA